MPSLKVPNKKMPRVGLPIIQVVHERLKCLILASDSPPERNDPPRSSPKLERGHSEINETCNIDFAQKQNLHIMYIHNTHTYIEREREFICVAIYIHIGIEREREEGKTGPNTKTPEPPWPKVMTPSRAARLLAS